MNQHSGHRARLKEEFMARPETFPDHKVLEVLLYYVNPRADTNPLAHTLMNHFGSLAGVLDATPEELCKISGMGPHACVLFRTVKEISGRYLNQRASVENRILSTAEAKSLLSSYFFGARNEMVYAVCMDNKHKLLGVRKICEGHVNAVDITVRLLVEAALSLNATSIILSHNHVSGLAFPSTEDKVATQHLKEVLQHIGIRLVDHIIMVDDDALSMRDSGMLND